MNLVEKLKINPEEISRTIEDFIKEQVEEFEREGIVIGISGGVDSSTVAKLCINAVGKDKVTGLIITEKQGNPEAEKYGRFFAEQVGIKIETRDMTKTLEALGVYNSLISHIPIRGFRERIAKKGTSIIKKIIGEHPFIHSLTGEDNKFIARNKANITIKQRVRMVYLYKYAEQNNLLAVGSAHKTEDFTGLFVKFGIDDAADVMPLKNLYRTQIVQLAEYLQVPEEILARSSNPDIIPGVKDKYKDILKINYDKLDIILYGLENNLDEKEIARQAGLGIEKIREIKRIKEKSRHMREHSRAPDF